MLPVQDIGHILRGVNNQASRDAIPATAAPEQRISPGPSAAAAVASKPSPQTTPAKRTSLAAGSAVIAVASTIGPAADPMPAKDTDVAAMVQTTAITPLPASGGQVTLSRQNVLDFAAQHPQMTLGEVLQ